MLTFLDISRCVRRPQKKYHARYIHNSYIMATAHTINLSKFCVHAIVKHKRIHYHSLQTATIKTSAMNSETKVLKHEPLTVLGFIEKLYGLSGREGKESLLTTQWPWIQIWIIKSITLNDSVSAASYQHSTVVSGFQQTNIPLLENLITDQFNYSYLLGLPCQIFKWNWNILFSLSFPVVHVITDRTSTGWFTRNLRGIRNKRNPLFKMYKRSGSSVDCVLYSRFRYTFQHLNVICYRNYLIRVKTRSTAVS